MREIFEPIVASGAPFHHFWLDVSADVLAKRIRAQVLAEDADRNAKIAEWRLAQVNRCVMSRLDLVEPTHHLDGTAPTPRLADEVIAAIREDR